MSLKTERRRQSGVAVAVVMLMLMLVVSFTTAAGVLSRQNYTNAAHKERMLEAEYAFRGGLARALERLAEEPTWNPTEAAPLQEMLSADGRVAYKVWLEGINRDSATPLLTPSGQSLSQGQAAIRVVPLIGGEEILSGFGGAEAVSILVRPQVTFAHNIAFPHPGEALDLWSGTATLLSYNSEAGILPFLALPGTPPPDNQRASVRSLWDIDLQATRVYGDAVLPTNATLRLSSGDCNGEQRDDRSLDCPRFVRPNPAGALTGLGGASQTLSPGAYDTLLTGDGAVIELERGGSYFFNSFQLGRNNTVNLTGTGEVVIYTHHFEIGDNSNVNMPPSGSAPIPKDLQICMTPQPDCEVTICKLSTNAQGAFVVAGTNVELSLMNNAQLFGAAIVHRVNLYNGSAVHFDEALLGKPMASQAQWALVAQGR